MPFLIRLSSVLAWKRKSSASLRLERKRLRGTQETGLLEVAELALLAPDCGATVKLDRDRPLRFNGRVPPHPHASALEA